MTTSTQPSTASGTRLRRPDRLHHAAWITRDSEATRHFYEDILGMPLVAAWCERTERHRDTGLQREFVHTFFALEDGGALAFFQYADQDERPIELTSPGHLALACDAETQQQLVDRLKANGYDPHVTNHGYCVSMYIKDPNNLQLEFTVDPPDVDEINARQLANAHSDLKRWLSGDRTPNNDIRPHR